MKVDILTPEQSQVQWIINFGQDTDLNNFEKIHSGGSTDSYIMRSQSHPNICMRVKREDFFRTLLQKRAEELANSRMLVPLPNPLETELSSMSCLFANSLLSSQTSGKASWPNQLSASATPHPHTQPQ